MKNNIIYDAIVVGSGATGGMAAKKLTEAGFKVLVIEAGKKLSTEVETRPFAPACDLPFKGTAISMSERKVRPNIMSTPFPSECNADMYVNEQENPFTTPKDKSFVWVRGRQVGGKTLTWWRQSYRMTDFEFKSASHDGYDVDWPISYKDIEPYYSEVESFIGVSGKNEGNLPHFPDGNYLPAMHFSPSEKEFRDVCAKTFGRIVTMGRTAVITRDWEGRTGLYTPTVSGRGFNPSAFFTSQVSTLAFAEATGNLTLKADTVVSHVTVDDFTHARGVWCIDANDPTIQFEIKSKVIILCASTLESTRILLNSTSKWHPGGLGNSSGVLGHYLNDHICFGGGTGTIDHLRGKEDSPYSTTRQNGIYIPRFRNLGSKPDPSLNFIRGYQFQGEFGIRTTWADWNNLVFGDDLKGSIARMENEWRAGLIGFGETLPNFNNQVSLNRNVRDKWGIPVLHIEMDRCQNDLNMYIDMGETAEEMFSALGATKIKKNVTPMPPGTAHDVGTARMGNNPKLSVLNAFNASHDVPNVFVTDGAAFTTSGYQNPTLTMMALTARACDYIIAKAKRGEFH